MPAYFWRTRGRSCHVALHLKTQTKRYVHAKWLLSMLAPIAAQRRSKRFWRTVTGTVVLSQLAHLTLRCAEGGLDQAPELTSIAHVS